MTKKELPHTKSVIINADDLGTAPKINDTIFELMSAEIITSATLIANAPYFEEASGNVSYFPKCSFGVHLNITVFQPLLKIDRLKGLLDENGHFNDKIWNVTITPSLCSAIYVEFCAQIEKILKRGIKISHIDSHEHVHNIPLILIILKLLQKKYNLRKARITRNIYSYDHEPSRALLFKKRIYNFMLRNIYRTKTTDGLSDIFTFYTNGKLNKIGHKTVEIMTHPGTTGYDDETDFLRSSWQDDLAFGVNLINYNELT
jgi:predicted glycoside hydrolase/deacetylase ChbG (UPF0249 family)